MLHVKAPHPTKHPTNTLALVSARLLPQRGQWQALANALPPGSILFMPPTTQDNRHQDAWAALMDSMRALGFRVFVVPDGALLSADLIDPARWTGRTTGP